MSGAPSDGLAGGAAVVAVGAISGFGRGREAFPIGEPGQLAPVAIADDAALEAAGLRHRRCVRAARHADDRYAQAPATALLADALAQCLDELDEDQPGWRGGRIGLCLGTSSGAMNQAEAFFRERHEGRSPQGVDRVTYFAPVDEAVAEAGLSLARRSQIIAACASSTIAIGLGLRWLEQGGCDLVLAGGYDALSIFVAAGFEALRATTPTDPRPFRRDRDGMVLGEAAGVVALAPARPGARFYVTGFGASADAVHITAPDRQGRGLMRAARAALRDAGCPPERVDLVSAHGTATPYNDAAEAQAIAGLVAPRTPWVHPYKAQIGHCLGAAGVMETLALARGLASGLVPAAAGDGEIDPDARVTLSDRTLARPLDAGLKLSAAFGGVAASLVVERDAASQRPARRRHATGVVRWVAIDRVDRGALAASLGVARDRLARIDDLGQLTVAALAALMAQLPAEALLGAGVIAGHALATLDTNERFEQRLLDKGPRRVDPRLFPATSPNAGAGHASIFFGLTGPCFSVNDGLDGGLEALEIAADLVAAGDAERMVVIAPDDAGPAARAWRDAVRPQARLERGAVAALVARVDDPLTPPGRALEPPLPRGATDPGGDLGHLGLKGWLAAAAARA